MIDGRNILDKLIRNNKNTYENIKKFTTAQGDDYATLCARLCLFPRIL